MKTIKLLLFVAIIALICGCEPNENLIKEPKPPVEEPAKDCEDELDLFDTETEEEPVDSAYLVYYSDRLEAMGMLRPKGSYNYPVYPGTEEWKHFQTGEEMDEACQVPLDILSTMSTQALLQAIWEFPLIFWIFHRSQYQSGFESYFFKNNAYNELITRQDAGSCILKRLYLLNPALNMNAKTVSNCFELLMSQPVFLSQLNDCQKKQLIKITFKNDSLRDVSKEVSNSDKMVVYLLIGRTLINANYMPFMECVNEDATLKQFFEDKYRTYFYNENIVQIITLYAENYLNNNKK